MDWILFDTNVMNMRAETLNAAYVRGYAERIGTLAIPEPVMQKHLEDLTNAELELLNAIGKKQS